MTNQKRKFKNKKAKTKDILSNLSPEKAISDINGAKSTFYSINQFKPSL
jgi:hypothetical protein